MLLYLYILPVIILSFKPALVYFNLYSIEFEILRYIGLVSAVIFVMLNYRKILKSSVVAILLFTLVLTIIDAAHNLNGWSELVNIIKVGIMISVVLIIVQDDGWRRRLERLISPLLISITLIVAISLISGNVKIESLSDLIGQVLLPGQNYIASSLVALAMLALVANHRFSFLIISVCIVIVLFMGSRTASIALLTTLAYIIYKNNAKIFIAVLPLIAYAISYIILNKWGATSYSGAAAGRLGPWNYYFDEITNSVMDLLPIFFSGNNPASYVFPETGLNTSPHNIFINMVLIFGWVAGGVIIFIMGASGILNKNHFSRAALLGLIIHASLEPVVWLSDNILSMVFFIVLISPFLNFDNSAIREKQIRQL